MSGKLILDISTTHNGQNYIRILVCTMTLLTLPLTFHVWAGNDRWKWQESISKLPTAMDRVGGFGEQLASRTESFGQLFLIVVSKTITACVHVTLPSRLFLVMWYQSIPCHR